MLKKLCTASALTLFCAIVPTAYAIEPDAPVKLIDAEQSIGLSLRHQLDRSKRRLSDREKEEYAALGSFYDNRDNAPYWTTENGLTKAATDMIAEIRRSDNYGLEPEKFNLASLPLARLHKTTCWAFRP